VLARGEVLIWARLGRRRFGFMSVDSQVVRVRFRGRDPLVFRIAEIECIRWSIGGTVLTIESDLVVVPKYDEFEPFRLVSCGFRLNKPYAVPG
jgi:hypothetical protein